MEFLKENFTNWSSENEIIDNFIQEKQLEYKRGVVFEWIPYDKFIGIEKIGKSNIATAIWEEGPLCYYEYEEEWIRSSDERVVLIYLFDSGDIANEFINKIKSYLLEEGNYGISQNPDTKDYILVFNEGLLVYHCKKCGERYNYQYENYEHGFEFEMDEMNNCCDLIFEWIPYNELTEIEELGKGGIGKFHVAIWKEGPLCYDTFEKEWLRQPYIEIVLKHLSCSENLNDESLSEVTVSYESYGISQNPSTKDYILVVNNKYYKYCKECNKEYIKLDYNYCESCLIKYLESNFINWTSKDEKIDDFIQKKQLKICIERSAIFEWIPYDEFIDIKEIGDNCLTTAIWKKGPLYFDTNGMKWMRKSYEKVCLRYLYNSQNITDEFIDEAEILSDYSYYKTYGCYGISQNPDTKNYVLLFNNEYFNEKYKRKLNKKVLLKYLYNSPNNNSFYSEIMYSIRESHGISQNPITKDFILVLQDKYYCIMCGKKYNNKFEICNTSCILCQTSHKNKKISNLIQEMKLNIDHNSSKFDIMFEWIPYDQFDDIKEIGKGGFSTVYSAIWKDGFLYLKYTSSWIRRPNTRVALKCLHNSQNFIDEFINEVKVYTKQKADNILKIYGISQNPDTEDYIMVLEYAEGGNFNNYLNENYKRFDWFNGLKVLTKIIEGLNKIHQDRMIHCDFHIGNILLTKKIRGIGIEIINDYINDIDDYNIIDDDYNTCISDMGLCRKIDDINEKSIYGVMPYVAPEVLNGKPYTQAADIYSFGMIMCWDLNPENRPNSIEIKEVIELFYNSLDQKFKNKKQHYEIENQFKETQESRKASFLLIKNNKSTTHTQAIYTSRLLNPFTKSLFDKSTVEITDFTNL
ncbi:kinase-like domain-containing protein [Rhizophagus clarus]|uniref:Kinase-like domain-containing protein n=1 Tax=Rhizophagus clarus TaxID=94130 RepID=A0A8H3LZW0_9GLOM|nr:kinase-like domain-containing protein [Rhizophagus clarus]